MTKTNGKIHPIEIKKSKTLGKKAIINFDVWKPLKKEENKYSYLKVEVGYGSVICMIDDWLPIVEKNCYALTLLIKKCSKHEVI